MRNHVFPCSEALLNCRPDWPSGHVSHITHYESTPPRNMRPKAAFHLQRRENGWELLPGEYRIYVGGSSNSTPLTASLKTLNP